MRSHRHKEERGGDSRHCNSPLGCTEPEAQEVAPARWLLSPWLARWLEFVPCWACRGCPEKPDTHTSATQHSTRCNTLSKDDAVGGGWSVAKGARSGDSRLVNTLGCTRDLAQWVTPAVGELEPPWQVRWRSRFMAHDDGWVGYSLRTTSATFFGRRSCTRPRFFPSPLYISPLPARILEFERRSPLLFLSQLSSSFVSACSSRSLW